MAHMKSIRVGAMASCKELGDRQGAAAVALTLAKPGPTH